MLKLTTRSGPVYRQVDSSPAGGTRSSPDMYVGAFLVIYIVYAISSIKRNYIYVGLTSDLDKRLDRHNKGYERTTKPYAPFRLIYQEQQETRQEARNREKHLKSGIGKEFLRKLRDA